MGTFAGYVRVSRVGDRGETLKSPTDQEREIKRWAKATHNTVEMLPHELDLSGGDDTRPVLLGAIERIERRELNGIVAYRLDRLWRSLSGSTKMIERIEAAGGEVKSATERFESDSSGTLHRNITLAIGQSERERRAEDFERSKSSAVAAGIYPARTPLGYVKGPSRRLEPDPATAPVVRDAFERRAAGQSWRSLADHMARRLGRDGMLPASVKSMIANPAYRGVARMGKHVNEKAHEPIVDRATWEAAQLDHPRPPRGTHGTGLLVGLVRCAGCSKRMTSTVGPKGRLYRCRKRHAGGECAEPATIGAYIEPYVTAAVFAQIAGGRVTYAQRTDALSEAESALEAAEDELRIYQEATEVAGIGAEHFAAGMRSRVAAVEQRRRAIAEAKLTAAPLPGVDDVASIWDELSVDELRHVLGGSLGVVWVAKGRGDIERRVRIVAKGFEPDGLSVQGIPSGPPVRFELPEGDLDGEIRPPSA